MFNAVCFSVQNVLIHSNFAHVSAALGISIDFGSYVMLWFPYSFFNLLNEKVEMVEHCYNLSKSVD